MTLPSSGKAGILLFYCVRQQPVGFPELGSIVLGDGNRTEIQVPCSGRVGVGELMQGLAAGYGKVAVLSCGAGSCVHDFGCIEAIKAVGRARRLAEIAGIDTSRIVFIEAEKPGEEDQENQGNQEHQNID